MENLAVVRNSDNLGDIASRNSLSFSGNYIGYARVSTSEQNISLQIDRLKAKGAVRIFEDDGISGSSREKREGLRKLLEYVREGDTLLITRIDRLARSARDLQNIVSELEEKKVSLKCTEQSFDTSRPEGRFMLGMLGLIAELETEMRRERQKEGIEVAKLKGKYKGRPADMKRVEKAIMLRSEGKSYAAIAEEVGITRSGVQAICRRQGKLF
ncbi:recombinase family protein (plasmid) [Acetobacteraceae bacterium]|nr:recombinase family protein [Acetobacteraceae bacterium]